MDDSERRWRDELKRIFDKYPKGTHTRDFERADRQTAVVIWHIILATRSGDDQAL